MAAQLDEANADEDAGSSPQVVEQSIDQQQAPVDLGSGDISTQLESEKGPEILEAGDSDQKTSSEVVVTPDPSDFSIRHPLQHTWTMWYDPPKKGQMNIHNWQDSVKKIMDFDTVEDFWCMFNNLASPDKIAHGCNYHLFKKGVHPSWEDPHNAQGGKWVLLLRDMATLNQLWENSVLAVIGEMFDYPDEVMGVVVSVRKGTSRLALWTRTAAVPEMCQRIGYHWKMLADIPPQVPLEYQVHAEALQTNSSFSNQAMYIV